MTYPRPHSELINSNTGIRARVSCHLREFTSSLYNTAPPQGYGGAGGRPRDGIIALWSWRESLRDPLVHPPHLTDEKSEARVIN